jgi:hypothetical protein
MAEHSAVNRRVVGSSPTCGANPITNWGGKYLPFFVWSERMFWVYILENARGKFYVGQTENPDQRLQDHNRTV